MLKGKTPARKGFWVCYCSIELCIYAMHLSDYQSFLNFFARKLGTHELTSCIRPIIRDDIRRLYDTIRILVSVNLKIKLLPVR